MKEHSRPFSRPWVLLVGAVALIAAHVIILRYVLPHAALSAVVSGVIILVVTKHLGLLGSLFALFRRKSRH